MRREEKGARKDNSDMKLKIRYLSLFEMVEGVFRLDSVKFAKH